MNTENAAYWLKDIDPDHSGNLAERLGNQYWVVDLTKRDVHASFRGDPREHVLEDDCECHCGAVAEPFPGDPRRNWYVHRSDTEVPMPTVGPSLPLEGQPTPTPRRSIP